MFQTTLEKLHVTRGPRNRLTLQVAQNLGVTLSQAGKTAEAADLLMKTLADQRLVMGPDHHDTLTTACSCGTTLLMVGRGRPVVCISFVIIFVFLPYISFFVFLCVYFSRIFLSQNFCISLRVFLSDCFLYFFVYISFNYFLIILYFFPIFLFSYFSAYISFSEFLYFFARISLLFSIFLCLYFFQLFLISRL